MLEKGIIGPHLARPEIIGRRLGCFIRAGRETPFHIAVRVQWAAFLAAAALQLVRPGPLTGWSCPNCVHLGERSLHVRLTPNSTARNRNAHPPCVLPFRVLESVLLRFRWSSRMPYDAQGSPLYDLNQFRPEHHPSVAGPSTSTYSAPAPQNVSIILTRNQSAPRIEPALTKGLFTGIRLVV